MTYNGLLSLSIHKNPENSPMLPLFELLKQANGGDAMNQMAKQFGLSAEQVQAATGALLPAFSMGLQRNTADPMGMGGFLAALASGQHGKYFDSVSQAFNPSGMQDGNAILGHLFGSKDASRAVAAHAAQATGIGQDILKQMLPVLATTLMGGMFKQSSGAMSQAAGMGAGDNIFGKVIDEMMRQSGGQRQSQPEEAAPVDPVADNPLGKILEGMFGGGQAAPQGNQNPMSDNPLGKILEELTKGAQGGGMPQGGNNPLGKILEGMFGGGQTQQEEPQQQRRQPQNPMGDALNDMFKTGHQTRDTYNKGLESIFDQMRRGMDR
jgi:hypothetical protein